MEEARDQSIHKGQGINPPHKRQARSGEKKRAKAGKITGQGERKSGESASLFS